MRKKWIIGGLLISALAVLAMAWTAFCAESAAEGAIGISGTLCLAICAYLMFNRSFDRKE